MDGPTQNHQNQDQTINKNMCHLCSKMFSSISAKNKHIKVIHKQQLPDKPKSHISCLLCKQTKYSCETFTPVIKNLKLIYSEERFEEWLREHKISTNYALVCATKIEDKIEKVYCCNRSDFRGFESKCSKRTIKCSGSIKMNGVCPSHLNVNIYGAGELLGECSSNNIEASHTVEIETFVNEKTTENQQVAVQRLNKQSTREIEIERVSNFLRSLNDETYDKCMRQLTSRMEQVNKTNTGKLKMDKQVYFPSKKKKEQ